MKLTAIFLLAICLNVHANGFAQRVSLSEKDAPLEKVFGEIKKQTGYTFVYREVLLQKAKKISVNISNASIEQVLDACLKDQPITYTIVNKMVVLNEKTVPVKKEQTAPPSMNIQGKVADAKGQPLAGATVSEKGTRNATRTKEDGSFAMSVAGESSILVVSFTGYAPEEVSVGNQAIISVQLVQEPRAMNDVVVVGYGTARKKDLTGSVASVSAKDFNKGNYASPDQLIQGKVSGVQIISNSGQPGGAATVKIRGNSAITGSGQPLYVVDGVPLDGRSARPGLNASGLGNAPDGNPLNFINPSDIASIEVLKDASATAIYGSRAAYGVVIINTKRGQSGQAKIDVGLSAGVSSIMRKIEVLDAARYREALSYYGVGSSNDKGGDVDALDAILQKGLQQNYNMAVSGGNESGKYRLSAGYLNQEGIVRKSGLKKYTGNFAANLKFLESKKLGLDINLTSNQYAEQIAPITNNPDAAAGNLIGQALQWNPTDPLRNADGSLAIKAGTVVNPLAMSELYDDHSKVTTVLGSISPYYKFANWLEYRMLYSINYSTGERRTSVNQDINIPATQGKGWANIGHNELSTQQITHTLNFNKEILPKLNLNALAGFEYMKFTNKGSGMSALGPNGGFGNYGLDYTNYIQYSNPSARTITSFVDPQAELQSYFGRAMFNFRDKYLLTATLRADGSTKFGGNNKYGFFPSFSGAWNISKEDFFRAGFVNSLKLRGGWGRTGNQEFPSGAAQARYSFSNNGGLGQVNNPNPDLKWQSDMQYNAGIDFTILNNKVSGTVDYFNKTTTDLLFPSAPIQPAPPGSVIRWINLDGNIVNKGIEASVNASVVNAKDFTWDLGANATFIKNTVSGLAAPIYTGALSGQGLSDVLVQVIQNGSPINTFYTRRFLGMDKGTGQAVYEDDGNTYFAVGNPNPQTLLGLSTTLRYKKLSLIANMNGAYGQDIYNNTLNAVLNVGSLNGGRNIAVSVYKDPVRESFANPVTASSRFIEKGNYLKMSNLTLSYNLGTVAKILKGANLYLTGQNLFVITKYSGFDPEVNVNKSNNGIPSLGIDFTPYPSAKTISFGTTFSL